MYNYTIYHILNTWPHSQALSGHEQKIERKEDKLFQALYRFSVLQATEIWAGPGTKATEYVFHCSLYCTKQVMQRASKGLLAPTEHKWLGVSAYNLGLTLFRGELFGDAVLVLELACEELLGWCEGGRSEEERVQRSEEVRVCTSVCACACMCVCVCVCVCVRMCVCV